MNEWRFCNPCSAIFLPPGVNLVFVRWPKKIPFIYVPCHPMPLILFFNCEHGSLDFIFLCLYGFISLTHKIHVLAEKKHVSVRSAAQIFSLYISIYLWCRFICFSLSICHCWWCIYFNLSTWWYLSGTSDKPDRIFMPPLFCIFLVDRMSMPMMLETMIFFPEI
jgi:hypothetical protein